MGSVLGFKTVRMGLLAGLGVGCLVAVAGCTVFPAPFPAQAETALAWPLTLVALVLLGALAAVAVISRTLVRPIAALDAQLALFDPAQTPRREDELVSLKQRVRALTAEMERLRQAERASADFRSFAGHEVRNPAAAVIGGIDVLLAHELPGQLAPLAERLESAANRLRDVIDAVFVPARIENAEIVSPSTPVDVPLQAARPLYLLLVEDDELVRYMLRGQIALLGHRLECVSNGLDALNAVASTRFDAVLMDMQMPVMDGIAALRAIRALGAPRGDVPVIALTADTASARRELSEGQGFHAFLTKPCAAATLRAVLQTVPLRVADGPAAGAVQAPLVSSDTFLQLERLLEAEGLADGLGALSRDLSALRNALPEGLSADDAARLKKAAQSFGAFRLSEKLSDSGSAAELDQVVGDTIVALDTLADGLNSSATA